MRRAMTIDVSAERPETCASFPSGSDLSLLWPLPA